MYLNTISILEAVHGLFLPQLPDALKHLEMLFQLCSYLFPQKKQPQAPWAEIVLQLKGLCVLEHFP